MTMVIIVVVMTMMIALLVIKLIVAVTIANTRKCVHGKLFDLFIMFTVKEIKLRR